MSTFESISSFDMSELLSGFVGALLGSFSSYLIAIYSSKKATKAMETERLRGYVATAVSLAGSLFDTFLSYRPNLLHQSRFGLKLDAESLERIEDSVELYGKGKHLTYLLPQVLRNRWDMMLVLIHEFHVAEGLDGPERNRAQVDVEHFIQYVRESCVDFLDGRKVRSELSRPYLRREDSEAWLPLEPNLE